MPFSFSLGGIAMPMKLSALDSITSGATGALHGNMGAGVHASVPAVLHDGLSAHLVSASLDGSLAPIAAAAVLLAAGGVHLLRTRPTLALRFPAE
jgi:hypothetical protein